MPFSGNHRHAGFTLVELLISIAIVGILAAMMFTNFSKEKARNDLKAAVQKIQTDLKTIQVNAQAGVTVNGTVPTTFTMNLSKNANSYTLQAIDANNASTVIKTVTFPTNFITINHFTDTATTNLVIGFTTPNGKATLTDTPATGLTTERVTLKHTTLNVCYAFDVTANVGTVTVRTLGTCS